MERPIGVRAKNESMDIERIMQKLYGDTYNQLSSFLRESCYQTVLETLEKENCSNAVIEQFVDAYKELAGKTIDKILELDNGQEKLDGIKQFLNEIS